MTANTSEIHVEDDSKLKHRDGRGRTSVTTRTERGHVGRGWELDTAVLVPHGALVGAHLGLRNVLVDAHRLVETLLLELQYVTLRARGDGAHRVYNTSTGLCRQRIRIKDDITRRDAPRITPLRDVVEAIRMPI